MSDKLFGTDGIRGQANSYPMTPEIALELGKALAVHFRRHAAHPRILIGKDTRNSGYMFEMALTAGICSMGGEVLLVGPLPTPAIAYLTRGMRADAGVVISASHNPFQDNGIKLFAHDGYKLPDETEAQLEAMLFDKQLQTQRPEPGKEGKAFRIDDARGRYIVFVKETLPKDFTLEGKKIVLDCANGAAYKVGPDILSELGAEVISIGCNPNGYNINDNCGAMYPERVSSLVKEHQADFGISLDGDADRALLCDEKGNLVNGDSIMGISALQLMQQKQLHQNTLVGTVMSNFGLEKLIQDHHGTFIRTQVGDRYVAQTLRDGKFNLGGEQSGHIIFADYTTTGDGMISALQTIRHVDQAGATLSELAQSIPQYPQILINVPITKRTGPMNIPAICEQVEAIESELGQEGRVLLRLSGTEPLARVMLEGTEQSHINQLAQRLADCVKQHLA